MYADIIPRSVNVQSYLQINQECFAFIASGLLSSVRSEPLPTHSTMQGHLLDVVIHTYNHVHVHVGYVSQPQHVSIIHEIRSACLW